MTKQAVDSHAGRFTRRTIHMPDDSHAGVNADARRFTCHSGRPAGRPAGPGRIMCGFQKIDFFKSRKTYFCKKTRKSSDLGLGASSLSKISTRAFRIRVRELCSCSGSLVGDKTSGRFTCPTIHMPDDSHAGRFTCWSI